MAISRLRNAIASALAFRHLLTRLAVLYAGLFALALFIVAAAAQVMILAHARTSVRAELSANAGVYGRVWTLRTKALSRTADVLRTISASAVQSAAAIGRPSNRRL